MSNLRAERLARFDRPGLYVVITSAFCAGRSPLEILDACLAAGVRHVQCREKDLPDAEYLALAKEFHARTHAAGASLIIDDRVDIALACGADGVHLGLSDLPLPDARRIAPDLLLGASSHNLDEALRAQDAGADYVNIGPIYATQTKETGCDALGPDAIGAIAPSLRVPFTCMGGIKPGNIAPLLARGARRCAVVTAVTAAPDPQAAAAELHQAILAAADARK
ncbi:MAG: thiamine phosphate synthase [Candidatus Hydrogenedens sp.]|nr:thiamine phosphate synthase [Candidatus Hydrogenedens sp.]